MLRSLAGPTLRKSSLARVIALSVVCASMASLPLYRPGRTAEAACWNNVRPLCDIISRYAISYNGGAGGGSYDISFTLKSGNLSNGTCGAGQADFWFLDDFCEYQVPSTGSGQNTFQYIVRVFPCDATRTQTFNAYIKLKAYDSVGTPMKSGGDPSPFFVDPSQFPSAGTIRSYDCNGNPI